MFVSVFVLAAAAAAPPPVLCNHQPVININPATLAHVRVNQRPLAISAEPEAEAAVAVEGREPASTAFSGVINGGAPWGYSRLTISFTPCSDVKQRELRPEQRNVLKRFFAGKQADKVLKLKVTVKPLGVSSSTTLSSIHRKSGKGGEEWVTEVENGGVLLPYFRVDGNTLIRVEADFQSTREYNSSISADVLDIIKRASLLISPAAPLITSQNKDRFNDAANFVDSSINGLMKVSIAEKPGVTVPFNEGQADQTLAVITLVVPGANDPFPSIDSPMVPVGQWTITAERVRTSMLGRKEAGAFVPGSYTASSVMNFGVAEGKTLREAFAGSSSVTAARDALIAAASDKSKQPGRVFCRTIASEADGLGLSPVDVGIATWAALTDLALPDEKVAKAVEGCKGVENFPE